MAKREIKGKRICVLDTNVLIHDPTSIFRFAEHDIYLPMIVIEELDSMKKGQTEVARNVRQASRFLDDLLTGNSIDQIRQGLSLANQLSETSQASGRLFFQTEKLERPDPMLLPGTNNDNSILGTAINLKKRFPDTTVTLVSKDINLRIKATVIGIHAEDYFNDQVLEDLDLLYLGSQTLNSDFWDEHSKDMESWKEEGHTYYRVQGPEVGHWHVNEFLYMDDDPAFNYRVHSCQEETAVIELVRDYQHNNPVWGINARNREQNYALNLLLNPDIDFVSLVGQAGTGKTLLTLAAALEQTIENELYQEIIMTRVTVPVGEDIGFLPGTEEEKMTPWMGALMDNLEVLTKTDDDHGEWGQAATNDLLQQRIKIRSLNFMRGRTFLNKFLIIDEAQNLTAKQMKTLITRAGPGTKVVCLGNIAQIDTPYITETSSGLTYVVDRFQNWEHSGHITLVRGERSRLADFASEAL